MRHNFFKMASANISKLSRQFGLCSNPTASTSWFINVYITYQHRANSAKRNYMRISIPNNPSCPGMQQPGSRHSRLPRLPCNQNVKKTNNIHTKQAFLYSNLLQHKIYNSCIIKLQQHKHIASYINQLCDNTINIMLVYVTPKIYHRDSLVDHCTLLYQRRHHLGIYKLLYFPKPKLLACTLVSLTAACKPASMTKQVLATTQKSKDGYS